MTQELDSAGQKWNPFLHSSTKTKTLTGRWRRSGSGKKRPAPSYNIFRADQLLREFRAIMVPTDGSHHMHTVGDEIYTTSNSSGGPLWGLDDWFIVALVLEYVDQQRKKYRH
jgi:hypothetical protein